MFVSIKNKILRNERKKIFMMKILSRGRIFLWFSVCQRDVRQKKMIKTLGIRGIIKYFQDHFAFIWNRFSLLSHYLLPLRNEISEKHFTLKSTHDKKFPEILLRNLSLLLSKYFLNHQFSIPWKVWTGKCMTVISWRFWEKQLMLFVLSVNLNSKGKILITEMRTFEPILEKNN